MQYYSSVSAVVFNDDRKILLVSKDGKTDWQVVTGWLENEDVQDGIKRELNEELGDIKLSIYDVIDVHSFRYKNKDLLSIWYLVKYHGGRIKTSDDIKDFHFEWFTAIEVENLNISCPKQPEILEKAFFLMDIYERNLNMNFLKFNQET